MNKVIPTFLATLTLASTTTYASSFTEAFTSGEPNLDIRFRYESVEQDNAVDDARALTVRTHLGYTTGSYKNFSAKIEVEDVRNAAGIDDYTVGPTGFKPGIYSVIADPEHTELDQGYIKYKSSSLETKIGRQVLTYDNHRFVGHVGWRQDRQTFDGLSIKNSPTKDLNINYSYLNKRNRIFAEIADIDSKDHLINVSYKSPIGKITGYGYLLETDNNTENALDTYGFSLKGGKDLTYHIELAEQTSESSTTDFDASYLMLEAGKNIAGLKIKLGYEQLGSDDANYGFSTPLATLHKFNGWSDQFLSTPKTGLIDTYVSVGGKLNKGKWLAVYHDFSTDESTTSVSDLGSELNLLFVKKLDKNYSTGLKFASYSAGDTASGKVDTDKLWLWFSAKI